MRDQLTKLLGAAALATALGAAPALAQADITEWDADGDGVMTEEEFDQGLGETAAFTDWDTDDDGVLSQEEFRLGVFNTYDEDGNGKLDEDELVQLKNDIGENGLWDW